MARIRAIDTGPEMTVRRLVHRMGYRYRLHRRDLPGCPDLVFWGLRKVIFVHGCFWHQHPDPNCKIAHIPKSRQDFWKQKLDANRARDARNKERLMADNWQVLTVWECQLQDLGSVSAELQQFLGIRPLKP